MPTKKQLERAKGLVDRLGIALVYPVDGKGETPSLWDALYPGTPMHWSWDADADPRVADVWHLREALARTHDVAYAKWFRGRATFFALPVFHALLGRVARAGDVRRTLPREGLEILELLRERSPMSTKEIRAEVGLRGKGTESVFQHAMKALWDGLLVVGVGEVPDGAFPSLAVSATELHFEDLWNARDDVATEAEARLDAILARSRPFRRQLERTLARIAQPIPAEDAWL